MAAGRGSVSQEQLSGIQTQVERIRGHIENEIASGDVQINQRNQFLNNPDSFPNESAKTTFTDLTRSYSNQIDTALAALKALKTTAQRILTELTTLMATPLAITAEEVTTKQNELNTLQAEFVSKKEALIKSQRAYKQFQQIQSITLNPDVTIQKFEIEHLNNLANSNGPNAVRQELDRINKALPREADNQVRYKLRGTDLTSTIPAGDHTKNETIITDGAAIQIQILARIKNNSLQTQLAAVDAQKILREITAFNPDNAAARIASLQTLKEINDEPENERKLQLIAGHKNNLGIADNNSFERLQDAPEAQKEAIFSALIEKQKTFNFQQIQHGIQQCIREEHNNLIELNEIIQILTALLSEEITPQNFKRALNHPDVKRTFHIAPVCDAKLLSDDAHIDLLKEMLHPFLSTLNTQLNVQQIKENIHDLAPSRDQLPGLALIFKQLYEAPTPAAQKVLLIANQASLNLAGRDLDSLNDDQITSITTSEEFGIQLIKLNGTQLRNELKNAAQTDDIAQRTLVLNVFNLIENAIKTKPEGRERANAVRDILRRHREALRLSTITTHPVLSNKTAQELNNTDTLRAAHRTLNTAQIIHEITTFNPPDLNATLNMLVTLVQPVGNQIVYELVYANLLEHAALLGIGLNPAAQTSIEMLDGDAGSVNQILAVVKTKIQTLYTDKIYQQMEALTAGRDPDKINDRLKALTDIIQAETREAMNAELLRHNDVLALDLDPRLATKNIIPLPNVDDIHAIKDFALQKKLDFAPDHMNDQILNSPNRIIANLDDLKPLADARDEAAIRATIQPLFGFNSEGLSLEILLDAQKKAFERLSITNTYYALLHKLEAPINSPLRQALNGPGVKTAIEAYAPALPADTRPFITTLTNPASTKDQIIAALVGTDQFGAAPLVDPAPLAQQLFAENQLRRLLEDETLPRDVKQGLARRRGNGVADNQVLHKLGEKATPDDVNRLVRQLKEAKHSEIMVPALSGLGLEDTPAIAQNLVNHGKVFRLLNANPFIAELLTEIVDPRNPAGNLNLLYIRDHENTILARIGGLSEETINQLIKRAENSNRADLITNLNALGIDLTQLTDPVLLNDAREEAIKALYAEKEYHRITELVGPAFKTVLHNHRADVVEKFKDLDTIIEPNAADAIETNKKLHALLHQTKPDKFAVKCFAFLGIPPADPQLPDVWKELGYRNKVAKNARERSRNKSEKIIERYDAIMKQYKSSAKHADRSEWDLRKVPGMKRNLETMQSTLLALKTELPINIEAISDTWQSITHNRTKLEKQLLDVENLLVQTKQLQVKLDAAPAVLTQLAHPKSDSDNIVRSEMVPVPVGAQPDEVMTAQMAAWRAAPLAVPVIPERELGGHVREHDPLGTFQNGRFVCVTEAKLPNTDHSFFLLEKLDPVRSEFTMQIHMPPDFDADNYPRITTGFRKRGVSLPNMDLLKTFALMVNKYLTSNPLVNEEYPFTISGAAFKKDEIEAIILLARLRNVPPHLIKVQGKHSDQIPVVTETQVRKLKNLVAEGKISLFSDLEKLPEKNLQEIETKVGLPTSTKPYGRGPTQAG